MDPQTLSQFANLPIELQLRITRHLSTPGFCAVRLTCKRVERALFHSFSHEFFRKKQFMLTDTSLQALLAISRHPALAPVLAHVVIGLDQFNSVDTAIVTYEQLLAYRQQAAAQFTLRYTGRAVAMLAEAFANLQKCGGLATIDIRDFNSRSRYRDGPDAMWTSYGATTVFQTTGIRLPMATAVRNQRLVNGQTVDDSVSAVFALVLRALAQANSRPVDLEVLIRNRHAGLSDFAFDLTSGGVGGISHNSALEDVVSHLRTLHLDICLDYKAMGMTRPQGNAANSFLHTSLLYGVLLHRFLAVANSLTWLRLNFQQTHSSYINTFMANLGQPLAPHSSPAPTRPLLNLQRLDLGHATLSPGIILKAIERIPSLRSLHIRRAALYDGSDDSRYPNFWAKFFRCLAENSTTSLTEFHVEAVEQGKRYPPPVSVKFDGRDSASSDGEPVKDFLGRLADVTTVDQSPFDQDVSDGDGDEDSEDDDS